jgi:hypothetical protein
MAQQEERMKKSTASDGQSPSELISKRIAELGDWRGEALSRIRSLITEAAPAVTEEWKWRGVPTWYHDGMICTGETYKDKVKVTFAKGAALKDPSKLFNSSLEGNVRRAIDLHESDTLNAAAFKALIRSAVALNKSAS